MVGAVAAAAAEDHPSSRRSPAIFLLTLLAIGLAAWLGHEPVLRFVAAWQARRNNAEALAARRLRAACRARRCLRCLCCTERLETGGVCE